MAHNSASETISSASDFSKTPEGWYERWDAEMSAAQKAHDKFHRQGVEVVNRYIDSRGTGDEVSTYSNFFKLNIFHSNIETMRSMLYGKLPKIDVSRENADPKDDVARVASNMLERMLNTDVKRYSQSYPAALRNCLDDRLITGFACAWLRYDFDSEEEEVMVYDQPVMTERIADESVDIDYVQWNDLEWSPCRVWKEKRWIARRLRMTKDQVAEKWGEKIASQVPMSKDSNTKAENEWETDGEQNNDAWQRANIWEIWSGEYKKVFFYCKGFPKILEEADDPLQLDGFYPCPQPMAANTTTRAYIPKPDYVLAQDLYQEIDKLESRIVKITEAVRVVGVYDASQEGIKRMLTEGVENDLIPIDNYAAFAERGGIAGQVDWMPIQEIAEVMLLLVQRRDDAMNMLYNITGMKEIMAGGGATKGGQAVSATEKALESKFTSIRLQALQDEFARFASDIMKIKAEIISIHFQPQSIAQQSNIMNTLDAQYAGEAMELIKDPSALAWRVEVRPESVAMVDYASLRSERTEYIQGISVFMQSAVPLIELDPSALPFLLEMLKWGMAGFKGSSDIETVLDSAIDAAMEAQKAAKEAAANAPPEPSPEELKAKAEMEKEQLKQQGDRQKEQSQLTLVQTKAEQDSQRLAQETQNRQSEIEFETAQSLLEEESQMEFNMEEQTHETDENIRLKREEASLSKEVIRAKPEGKASE